MYEWFFNGFSMAQILVLGFCAILIGINKTGMPGIGTLPVVMLMLTFEPRLSTGLQLMMLGAADLIAVTFYRRHANWVIVMKLLPWALVGIAVGILVLRGLDGGMLRVAIGWIIIVMVMLNFLRQRFLKNTENLPDHWMFSAFFGLAAGLTTQVANAAGPVMAIYLLSMRLPKKEYMGSCAWYFLILNWLKIPIFIFEGRITAAAFKADLAMLPLLLVGGMLGILFINKINQKVFEIIIQVLVVVTAIYLIVSSPSA